MNPSIRRRLTYLASVSALGFSLAALPVDLAAFGLANEGKAFAHAH